MQKEILDILERLDGKRQEAVLAFAQAALDKQNGVKDIGPIDPETTPKWADRTTGREVNAVDFVKKHYGSEDENGTWKPIEGLELKHIGNYDKELYMSYIQMTRRHPDRDLGIPKGNRTTIKTAEDALSYVEKTRKKDRNRKRKNL